MEDTLCKGMICSWKHFPHKICRELHFHLNNKLALNKVNTNDTSNEESFIHVYMCAHVTIYTESPELSLKVLSTELKTVTDPIQLGVGLGVAQYHLEIIRKNNPQGLCACYV